MPSSKIRLVYTRVFEGTLHERLYDIWDAWASRHPEVEVIQQLNDTGKNHQEMLEEIWDDHHEGCDILIMTEHDFIPAETLVDEVTTRMKSNCATLVEYCTRNPQDLSLIRHPVSGGWFMAFRPAFFGSRPDFGGKDPGNNLDATIFSQTGSSWYILPGVNDKLGISYPRLGTHLFWSRHINDSPQSYAAGFSIREIQRYWVQRISEKEELCENSLPSPSAS